MGRARNRFHPSAVGSRFDRVFGVRRGDGRARDWLDTDGWVLDGAFARQEHDGVRLSSRLSMPLPTHHGVMVIYLDGAPYALVEGDTAHIADLIQEIPDYNFSAAELSDFIALRDALKTRIEEQDHTYWTLGSTRIGDVAHYARYVARPPANFHAAVSGDTPTI